MEGTPRSRLDRAQRGLDFASDSCMPHLGESSLHVWFLDLDLVRESLAMHEEVLSADEWRRIRGISSHQLGRRFIARRGLLRLILGQYLGCPPKEIRFDYNVHGKPFLAPELTLDLQFSLSDSGDKAAIAVGLGEPLGIDIERLRTVRLEGELASPCSVGLKVERAESPAENEQCDEFLQAWTCREALAKAEGVGLQMLTSQSDFSDMTDDVPIASIANGPIRRVGFHVHSLTLPDDYVGALATRLKAPRIVYCPS